MSKFEYHCHQCSRVLEPGNFVIIEKGFGRYFCGEPCSEKYVDDYLKKYPGLAGEISKRSFCFGRLEKLNVN